MVRNMFMAAALCMSTRRIPGRCFGQRVDNRMSLGMHSLPFSTTRRRRCGRRRRRLLEGSQMPE